MEILAYYALAMFVIVIIQELGKSVTIEGFLTANRNVGGITGSMSIAASWIWAPAIFVSSAVGYKYGFPGLFWFCIPNMLSLIIFAPFAHKVRCVIPLGYSYIEFLRAKKHLEFGNVQLVLQLIMQVVIFAIQLTAGAKMLSITTGSPYWILVLGMAITPLAYVLLSGLRTSIFTDALQYILIAGGALFILLHFPKTEAWGLTFHQSPRIETFNLNLLLDFGISSSLGLIVAIFADHQQWQRIFAISQGKIIKTYFSAALLHGLITVSLGTLGILIFNSGFNSANNEMISIEYIKAFYSPVFTIFFTIMALAALISTLDSGLCAFSSLCVTELKPQTYSIKLARLFMLLLTALASSLALCEMQIIILWFIAGTIRLSSFFPTISSIILPSFSGRIGIIAISTSLLLGTPVFAYGAITENTSIRTIGMCLTLLISFLLTSLNYPFIPRWRNSLSTGISTTPLS